MSSKLDPNEPVTRSILNDAVETILQGMDELFTKHDKRLDKIEDGLQGLKVEVRYLKDEVKGLKSDYSDTPSRRELNQLKARVDKYHPLS